MYLRRLSVFVLAVALMLPVWGGAPSAQESGTYSIKTGRAIQWDGVRTNKYTGWTQINPNNPNRFNAWVKPNGRKRIRANWKKAKGAMGDIHGNRVAFAQRR